MTQTAPVMVDDRLQFLHVAATQILLVLQSVFSRRLRAELWEAEEDGFQVGVVDPGHHCLHKNNAQKWHTNLSLEHAGITNMIEFSL